jgi:hypothetical protein
MAVGILKEDGPDVQSGQMPTGNSTNRTMSTGWEAWRWSHINPRSACTKFLGSCNGNESEKGEQGKAHSPYINKLVAVCSTKLH